MPDTRVRQFTKFLSRLDGGEIFATFSSAIVGGICLSLLDLQPVSATGAILQDAMIYADGEKGIKFLHFEGTTREIAQTVVVFRLCALLCSVAIGTIIGRYLACKEQFKAALCLLVPSMLILTTIAAICVTTIYGGNISFFWRGVLSVFFGLSTGMMWGCMPEDSHTTAKSAILKRASLGDISAIIQLVFFVILCISAVDTFSRITLSNPTGFVGVIFLLLVLAVSSYWSIGFYLSSWKKDHPPRTLTPGQLYISMIFIVTLLFVSLFVVYKYDPHIHFS